MFSRKEEKSRKIFLHSHQLVFVFVKVLDINKKLEQT